MTLPLRKKRQTTAQTVAPKLLVSLLSYSFLFPALPPTSIFAGEPQPVSRPAGFERGDWQNRTQPTWINNAPDGEGLRESSMLDWGPKAKPISLSHPRRADRPSNSTSPAFTSPLLTASNVPASMAVKRQVAQQAPTDIRIALNPATGAPDQRHTGISLLQSQNYLDPSSLASSQDATDVETVGYSVEADFQTEQRRAADEARSAVEEKVRVLQSRATRNLQRKTSRVAKPKSKSNSRSVAFTDPTPPIDSYTNLAARIQQSNHQAPGGGYFQPPPPAQPNTGHQYSLPQDDSIPDLLNEPPAFSTQDLNELQQVPQAAQPESQALSRPSADPFGADGGRQPNNGVQQQPPKRNSGVKPFEDLFKDPSGDASDSDLEAELRRLEDKSGNRNEDLERELRGLGLDDEASDGNDNNKELPSSPNEEDDVPNDKTHSDCGRIYDDRDCCAEDKECQRAFDILKSSTLASLSLDISPSFDPSEDDPDELIRRRTEKLMSSPSRSWMDRTGNIVANGMFEDLRYGKVHIRSDGGETVTVPYRDLSRDDLCFVNAWWQIPAECPLGNEPLAIRDWTMTTFTWKAAGTCHKPLYFEHLELERYGHSAGPVLQPVLSGAHFFANVILLPYNSGIHPPTECLYDLGNYRPGDCAPWLIPAIPLQKRATLFETALGLGIWGLF